ncbi:MAG: peptide-methionine (S)-S-oxide reductase MsrA [Pseudomonadales bacterium]|nr:peptide-methionine (S)-S-oxide reductase MsrA [Pseudomonadales bacterium]
MLQTSNQIPPPEEALPGRPEPLPLRNAHFLTGRALRPPFPEGSEKFLAGMGCFWGAERLFSKIPGVLVTAVGYSGGHTPNPTYEEVCSGLTGHAEVVLVVYRPVQLEFNSLLQVFWESHDPTQGMRQGNDVGTQYRSALYLFSEEQEQLARESRLLYQSQLSGSGLSEITTEISRERAFYYAEDYHQQYLAKIPHGYCGLVGTGVACDLMSEHETETT